VGKAAEKEKGKRRSAMVNLEAKTKLSPEEVASKLKKFFGKGGWGLDLTEETAQCITFEEGKTRVNLVTQEWDYQVKEFLSGLS
jgi:hypothetical protein